MILPGFAFQRLPPNDCGRQMLRPGCDRGKRVYRAGAMGANAQCTNRLAQSNRKLKATACGAGSTISSRMAAVAPLARVGSRGGPVRYSAGLNARTPSARDRKSVV